jgi:hypothetical protein
MKEMGPASALTLTVTLYGLCPAHVQKPFVIPTVQTVHPPQQADDPSTGTYAPEPLPVLDASGMGGTSTNVPFGWQNNSMFEAANVVIRQHHARRAAQTHIAQMSMPSTNWLLSSIGR